MILTFKSYSNKKTEITCVEDFKLVNVKMNLGIRHYVLYFDRKIDKFCISEHDCKKQTDTINEYSSLEEAFMVFKDKYSRHEYDYDLNNYVFLMLERIVKENYKFTLIEPYGSFDYYNNIQTYTDLYEYPLYGRTCGGYKEVYFYFRNSFYGKVFYVKEVLHVGHLGKGFESNLYMYRDLRQAYNHFFKCLYKEENYYQNIERIRQIIYKAYEYKLLKNIDNNTYSLQYEVISYLVYAYSYSVRLADLFWEKNWQSINKLIEKGMNLIGSIDYLLETTGGLENKLMTYEEYRKIFIGYLIRDNNYLPSEVQRESNEIENIIKYEYKDGTSASLAAYSYSVGL